MTYFQKYYMLVIAKFLDIPCSIEMRIFKRARLNNTYRSNTGVPRPHVQYCIEAHMNRQINGNVYSSHSGDLNEQCALCT